MCIKLVRTKRKSRKGTTYYNGIEWVNFRLLSSEDDFYEIKARMEKQLGFKVYKADVLRHAISFTNQHYNNPVGIR